MTDAPLDKRDEFIEGFNIKTVLGALFIGLIMMPGSIYLGLVAGQTMGPAAEWVTIILFLEVARRSFVVLKRQEIYILYYVAAGLTAWMGIVALSGGIFATLIWNQYFVRSPAAAPFAHQIPNWVCPPPESEALVKRTFFHKDWLPAIGVIFASYILGRVNTISLGYALFRLTADYERLPFPLAPVAAQGATALAESSAGQETWRWRVFSIGAMIGISFGLIYVGLPTISGLILVRPVQILPIPWIDMTQAIERWLPATPFGIGTNIIAIMIGMVLPFWVIVGGFVAAMATLIVNPILYKMGVLHSWKPGMDTIHASFANQFDFYLSFGIGTGVAVGLIGIVKMIQMTLRPRETRAEEGPRSIIVPPRPDRGDSPLWFPLAVALFILSTVGYIVLCAKLVPGFPVIYFVLFGFVITPFLSYINARMVGITGQFVSIPFIREAFILASRYKGVAIWFAPIPLLMAGGWPQLFRELELTRTKFTSLIKAEILAFAVMVPCSLVFWSYIWRLAPIPSAQYPYAQKFWPYTAMMQALWITATTERQELLWEALKWKVIMGGLGFGILGYVVLSWLRWPVALIYGVIRGLGTMPHFIVLEMVGAVLGRYYFAKKFGRENWARFTPVLLAGASCGMGLVGMIGVAAALILQSIKRLPY